ncbi:hypothetical protein [Streptomyces sp. NPDC051219]|uniref:hypothetical protein n=1 Tax=Streptomyces sp. NPDC051219 TaxID=3155283 RepID=UPI003432978E
MSTEGLPEAAPAQWDVPPRRKWQLPLVGGCAAALGCGLLLALTPAVLLGLMVLGRYLFPPPVPLGDPLVLTQAELVGAWQDEEGGTLALAPDMTFTAAGVCTADEPVVLAPGPGTWRHDEWALPDDDAPATQVDFDYNDEFFSYEAIGTQDAPALWTYVGDPDSGELCVLTRK